MERGAELVQIAYIVLIQILHRIFLLAFGLVGRPERAGFIVTEWSSEGAITIRNPKVLRQPRPSRELRQANVIQARQPPVASQRN